ncbi:VWA domain-containing protein [Nocardioides limicola]|uniref:VWA domain-containing protein n=1 Tax=Nocardioides limicola TaxID=2803368 RepID=UPI00193B495D|nr:VWA domain-containing protein [Nocardioides sp. DJM-14]
MSIVDTRVWLWPLAGVVVLLATAACAVVAYLWGRRLRGAAGALPLAHTEYLTALPAFRALRRRHRSWLVAGLVTLLVGIVSTAALTARPAERELLEQRLATRDIVLCLDVSGSMIPYVAEVIDVYTELTENFAGERIALVLFNSTSRTVFPLTDDYRLVLAELTYASERLDDALWLSERDVEKWDPDVLDRVVTFFAGTESADGASLVGDGLASCALQFDEQATERSRSVVLTTDNEVFMEGVYTLEEAADLATSRDITLYGLYAGDRLGGPSESEYREVVDARDGLYFTVTDPRAVDDLVADVIAQQAVVLGADAEEILADTPRGWFLGALFGVGLLVLLGARGRS